MSIFCCCSVVSLLLLFKNATDGLYHRKNKDFVSLIRQQQILCDT